MSTTEPADLRTKRLREQDEEAVYGPVEASAAPTGTNIPGSYYWWDSSGPAANWL